MIDLFLILGIALMLIITNYIALIYGIHIGKAMQKDIPPVPIVTTLKKAALVSYKLIKNWPKKVYLQKKARKEENNIWD